MMCTKRVTVALVVFLLLADAQAFAAAPIQGDLTWSELSARLTPRHGVRMVLPDGATIEGNLLRVTADAIVLSITKTSNRSHPELQPGPRPDGPRLGHLYLDCQIEVPGRPR